MRSNTLKKITITAVLSAFALVSFMLEQLLPPLILPGAKIGVANVFVLLCAILIGPKSAFAVVIVKSVLGSVFSGNVSAIMYSLPSGIIALTVEIALFRYAEKLSIVSISILGAVISSLVQNVVFCLTTNAIEYLIYLPYLALIGVLAGAVVGFAVFVVIKIFPENAVYRISKENEVVNKR